MKKHIVILSIIYGLVALGTQAMADAELEKGKTIYNGIGACFTCHGATGKGDGAAAVALNPKPRSFANAEYLYDTDKDGKKGTDTDLANILTFGTMKYGGSPLMAGRADIKGDDQKALIKFIRSLEAAK